jgi:signal transduction histidine kinase
METYLGEKGTLQIECPDSVPRIWADSSHLRLSVLEIVRNACEASREKGVVTVSAAAESRVPQGLSNAAQPITWISITVTDHGPGIPAHLTERVFNPFFTTRQQQNAAGLGLTVALGLVQRMGGVIRIDSKPGNTVVRVLLPSRSETM